MRPAWIVGGTAVAAAAAIAIAALRSRGGGGEHVVPARPERGFDFIARDGTVLVNGHAVSVGTLAPGDALDTRASRVELLVGDLGRAELDPATRVRLERDEPAVRQLALDRGTLQVRVTAPPRLFVVTTPVAKVIDLGCAYTLEVEATGTGRIAVQRGRVELVASSGAAVRVPAGAHSLLVRGTLPGLPIADGARAELEEAVAKYLAGGPAEAVLAAATARDGVTLEALARVAAPGAAAANSTKTP